MPFIQRNTVNGRQTYLTVSLATLVLFSISCGKTSDSPTVSVSGTDTSTYKGQIIAGATSSFMDTIIKTIGDITIKYSRTSQCYPSNEIFAFTVSSPLFPSNASYYWDFGDGKNATSGSTVANIYQTAGKYTVSVTVSDTGKRKISTTSVSVRAFGQQVTPHASVYAQLFDINYPNYLHFNANGTKVVNGKINNYLWIWGDGDSTSSPTPDNIPHGFPKINQDKTYPVQLIATSDAGCKDTATIPVSIESVYNITGDFDAVSRDKCTSEYFVFTSNAKGVPAGAEYSWNFTDYSGTYYGNPIKHSYATKRTNDVVMSIAYKGKTIYSITKPILSFGQNIKPKALFGKSVKEETSTSVKWEFYDQSFTFQGTLDKRIWDIDNGTIDNAGNTNIVYTYPKGSFPVNHPIKFIVTNDSGCMDTAYSTITIPAK